MFSEKTNRLILYERTLVASSKLKVGNHYKFIRSKAKYVPFRLQKGGNLYVLSWTDWNKRFIAHRLQKVWCVRPLFNNVGNIFPQKMLQLFIFKLGKNFLTRQKGEIQGSSPFPPHLQRIPSQLIMKARPNKESVPFFWLYNYDRINFGKPYRFYSPSTSSS